MFLTAKILDFKVQIHYLKKKNNGEFLCSIFYAKTDLKIVTRKTYLKEKIISKKILDWQAENWTKNTSIHQLKLLESPCYLWVCLTRHVL